MTHEQFNFAEGCFWLAIATGLLVASVRKKRMRKFLLGGALFFAFFGISDFVEVRTGAWWKPWWLLVWKTGCLGGLAVVYRSYRKQ